MVSPEDVLRLKRPADKFLCQLSANRHGLDFLAFTISDFASKTVFFHVDKDNPIQNSTLKTRNKIASETALRTINYNFSADVLRTDTISTKLIFSVGNKRPVDDFRLIERHYVKDKLIKSYDFQFGFCIPKSTNTWEAIYAVPLLDEKIITEMINQPGITVSDSFYFVNDKLVIHNKANYTYTERPYRPGRQIKGHERKMSEEEDSCVEFEEEKESKQEKIMKRKQDFVH